MQTLKIYLDRLKAESELRIDESVEPQFLATPTQELQFKDPVKIKGQAYLADDHLIVECALSTVGYLPCSICNQPTPVAVNKPDLRLVIPVEEIKGSVFELLDSVREEILLDIPQFAECGQGHCPERVSVSPFMKAKDEHFPFADIGL